MNINELIKEAHQIAVEHGWWENADLDEKLALIHSELSEALEEYRNGHGLNEVYYNCKNNFDLPQTCIMKPEGIPIELADVCIRIYDFIGHLGFKGYFDSYVLSGTNHTFSSFITSGHLYVSYAFLETDKATNWLLGLNFFIGYYCQTNGINIENAIRIKMDYNKTRPYRHGGKRA